MLIKDGDIMNKLYIITGPAGVGKSSVSKELAFNLAKSVLIEGDDIYHQVVGSYHSPWHELNHLDTFWKVSINIIKTYLSEGDDVVFNYIMNNDSYQNIKQELKNIDINLTVLMVNKDTLMKRDNMREEDCQMKERCIELLEEFKMYNFDNENILYTDNLSIKETVDKILNKRSQHE